LQVVDQYCCRFFHVDWAFYLDIHTRWKIIAIINENF
jgi:hypothetical protein